MLSNLLGQMAMTIFNQTYGISSIVTLIERYSEITDQAMSMSFINAIITTIKSLAAGFAVLTFLIDLSEKVTEKNFSTEQFFKATLRLFVAYLFIMYSDVIVGYLMDAGKEIAIDTEANDYGSQFFIGTEKAANRQMLINGISKMKMTEMLGYILTSLLPWVLSILSAVILQIILISRILEIIVMTALAPISIADIYRDGTSSSGVHYMKKMFALGLQVAVIIMINVATQAIIQAVVGTGAGSSITYLLKMTEYTGDAQEALNNGTLVFTVESISDFLDALTGRDAIFKALGIMLARVGMIWNSMPLCEEIAGAK